MSNSEPPSAAVNLSVDNQQLGYRLVLHPLTRQPARDRLGNYLYMPLGETLHEAI